MTRRSKDTNADELRKHVGPVAPTSPIEGLSWHDTSQATAKTFVNGNWHIDGLGPIHNGTFLQFFNALVTEDGGTVTMSLERADGGDLTMLFGDGQTNLDCTPACTIELTTGSIASPTQNFIYIPKSTKVLTKSISGFPQDSEHIRVGYFFVPNAAEVATRGVYVNQNINDAASDGDGRGHLAHIGERIRHEGALYESGMDLTLTGDGTGTITVAVAAGVMAQMHHHDTAAQNTASGDVMLVVNHSATPNVAVTSLTTPVLDSDGDPLSNKWYNLVLWLVGNKGGEFGPLMLNLPSGSYTTQSDAEADATNEDSFAIPAQYGIKSSTGLLLYRITLKHSPAAGGTWTLGEIRDLRGQTPQTAGGGGGSVASTVFADNAFRIQDDGDATKQISFQASGISTGNTREITMPDTDITLLKHNVSAGAPGVNNDNTEGYAQGSHWVRVGTNQVWILMDALTGAAVWQEMATGSNAFDEASDPTVSNDNTQGFHAGSIWANTTASPDRVFILKDPATGAADWIEIVDAYSHPDHTGDVTSSGDGATAIAAGVIVNANVKSDAAIALTKLATGTNRQVIGVNGTPANKAHTRLISHVTQFDLPVEGDRRVLGRIGSASTMFEIHGKTNLGTVAFQVVECTASQVFSGGTNILTSEQNATIGDGADYDTGDMSNTGLAANTYLVVVLGVVTTASNLIISSDHEIDVPA